MQPRLKTPDQPDTLCAGADIRPAHCIRWLVSAPARRSSGQASAVTLTGKYLSSQSRMMLITRVFDSAIMK